MFTGREFFEWLGKDSLGVPYYLHLLNHRWSPNGVEHDLQVYRSAADRLRTEPDLWASILRGALSWRGTLVGCACLLLTRERGFLSELTEVFEHGSMVQPQIAVTIALLHPAEARIFFEEFLRSAKPQISARAVVSAQRVLQRLGALADSDVRLSGWANERQTDDALLANQVAIQHWDFWASRL